MAAPWNDGDPQSYPYSTGGPSSGGGLMGFLKGFADVVGGGAASGYGLGDASSGMAGGAAEGSRIRQTFAETTRAAQEAARKAQDAAEEIGSIPGAGTLWTLNGGSIEILPQGWLVLAGAGVGLWLLLGGR